MAKSPETGLKSLSTSLDDTLGPLLIGAVLSVALWGVTCTQTYDYFMDNRDGRLQRSVVALLWMLDTLVSVMHSHLAYFYAVTCYINPSGFQLGTWSINSHSLISAISNFIIRCMFARRIHQFGRRSIFVPMWIISVSFCELVIVTVITAKAFQGPDPVLMRTISKLLYISYALSVTADLSVTIALCWLLQSAKSGFPKSDSIVNILIAYVVNTGLLVTVIVTVGLILYIVTQDKEIFLVFFILGAKLYLNAYLSSLNARGRLRMHTDSSMIPLSLLEVSRSHGRDNQDSVLTNERTRSFDNPASTSSSEKTVERREDNVSDEVKHPPQAGPSNRSLA